MTEASQTPSQTIGPFFHDALIGTGQAQLDSLAGAHVVVVGSVLDGQRQPVDDAMLEVWHADSEGRYPHPADDRQGAVDSGFTGFVRVATSGGSFIIDALLPGPVPGRERQQAPHLNVFVFARGLLDKLATRIYFADHADNETDEVLTSVPAARGETLVAARDGDHGGIPRYRLDIVLQGDDETVFFDS